MSIFPALAMLANVAPATQSAAATDLETGGIFLAVLVFFTVLAVAVAIRFKVFHKASVLGPRRLPDRGATSMLLLSLFITLCVWLFVQQAYIGYRQRQWQSEGVQDVAHRIESLLQPRDMAFLSTIPPLLGFALMLAMGRFLGEGWLDRIGISGRKLLPGIGGGAVGFLVVGPMVFWTIIALTVTYRLIHFDHPAEHALLKSLGQSNERVSAALIAFGATLCAPLFEEFLFRGHLQTALRQGLARIAEKLNPSPSMEAIPGIPAAFLSPPPPPPECSIDTGPLAAVLPYAGPSLLPTAILNPPAWAGWGAILVTSAIFAMFHPMWMWPPIFVLSLGLGYVYERTGNLWAAITMHCLFNSLETAQYLLLLRGH